MILAKLKQIQIIKISVMKKIFFLLAVVSLFLSCSNSDDDDKNDIVPIKLTSKITLENRDALQSVQIANGQKVSFFVSKTPGTTNIVYDNALLTADGNGNFSYESDGQNVLYYPVEAGNVDFYAVHPYSDATSLGSVMNFEVEPDQSVLANYYNSDLLYSQVKDISRTRNAIPMVFNHKLSKVSFVVKQGVGLDLSNLTSIQIMNVQSDINMNINDGSLVPIAGTNTEISVYGVKGTTGEQTQISGMAAIIVPQSFVTDGSKRLFRLVINGADYYYTPSVGILFEEGKEYNFTLTVNNTGIEVTSSIVDWLPGDNIDGDVD